MKTKHTVWMIVFLLLTVLVLVNNVCLLIRSFSGSIFDAVKVTDIIVLLLAVFYAVMGYRKPHGNLLKLLMLIFAISMIPRVYSDAMNSRVLIFIIHIFSIIGIAYVAGRLNRINQNKYLMAVIMILIIVSRVLLAFSFKSAFDLMNCIGSYSPVIVWLDICIAYFLRYKEHREAGLEDGDANFDYAKLPDADAEMAREDC